VSTAVLMLLLRAGLCGARAVLWTDVLQASGSTQTRGVHGRVLSWNRLSMCPVGVLIPVLHVSCVRRYRDTTRCG
jgi:hypothetical protein